MEPQRELIRIEGVTKRFGHIVAVDEVNATIRENEFFALLGPSGCGKTTLMRLLAGFETPDAGRLLLDGRDLVGVRPYRRPLNMMFQSYALFPHMTVFDNIAYGLRQEGAGRGEIERRVADALALVQLTGFGRRRPHQLSGGERQRVALARALVKRPKGLLLDEPLAALDRKLRVEIQLERAGRWVPCDRQTRDAGALNRVDGVVGDVVYLGSTRKYVVELSDGSRALSRVQVGQRGDDLTPGTRVSTTWAIKHGVLVPAEAASSWSGAGTVLGLAPAAADNSATAG